MTYKKGTKGVPYKWSSLHAKPNFRQKTLHVRKIIPSAFNHETILGFQHLGCFAEDPLNPSLPILLGKKVSSRYTAQECFELAGLLGHPIFGIRDYECYAAPTNTTYDSKGTSTSCNCERGALNSVSAFKVDFSKPVLDFEAGQSILPDSRNHKPKRALKKQDCVFSHLPAFNAGAEKDI